MNGDVNTFTILLLSASTFYVAGLATLIGVWALEKSPPEKYTPPPKKTIPQTTLSSANTNLTYRIDFRF